MLGLALWVGLSWLLVAANLWFFQTFGGDRGWGYCLVSTGVAGSGMLSVAYTIHLLGRFLQCGG